MNRLVFMTLFYINFNKKIGAKGRRKYDGTIKN